MTKPNQGRFGVYEWSKAGEPYMREILDYKSHAQNAAYNADVVHKPKMKRAQDVLVINLDTGEIV